MMTKQMQLITKRFSHTINFKNMFWGCANVPSIKNKKNIITLNMALCIHVSWIKNQYCTKPAFFSDLVWWIIYSTLGETLKIRSVVCELFTCVFSTKKSSIKHCVTPFFNSLFPFPSTYRMFSFGALPKAFMAPHSCLCSAQPARWQVRSQ